MSDLYLGIDGGGTKTAACILDDGCAERGRGLAGPCNIATGDRAVVRSSLHQAISGAIAQAAIPAAVEFEVVCAGVAGYSSRKARGEFEALLHEVVRAQRYRVEPDFVTAWWGASGGEPGVLVSAGTGAVVYGRSARGRTARADGRGFLLGDRGSAFDIGREALETLVRRANAGQRPWSIDERILTEIGASGVEDAVQFVYRDFDPARIASLGGRIAGWAAAGDQDACITLCVPLMHLAGSAWEVLVALDMPARRTPLFLSGGLWIAGEQAARRRFERYLVWFHRNHRRLGGKKRGKKLRLDLREPLHDPAYGAALLAMQPPR